MKMCALLYVAIGGSSRCRLVLIVGAVVSEKGVRCFFRGKSNLKTVLVSLRGVLLGIQCCQKIFSMAT